MPYLELTRGDDGPRHSIGVREVHTGDAIELLMIDREGRRNWVLGRYEWSHNEHDAAWFYYVDGDNRDRIHLLVNGTEVRWPK